MFVRFARAHGLRTVAETLDAMKYHDAGAFVSDVRLIFDNARKYNPPKHPIHVAATKLSKVNERSVCRTWFAVFIGRAPFMLDAARKQEHRAAWEIVRRD